MSSRHCILLLLLFATLASAQRTSPKPSSKPQEVFAPYWVSEPGWDTEFEMKNNLTSVPLTVTPILRLASGDEIPLDPVTISPNAAVSVWANKGLLQHSPNLLSQSGSYGSVVFRFNSLDAMNLHATVRLTIHGASPLHFLLPHTPRGSI